MRYHHAGSWLSSRVLASWVALACSAVASAAPVSWTGLGDGVNWSDPANWSGNALPLAADDVTIDVAASPTIIVAGVSPSIRSLTCAEAIQINAGATLSVSTTATSSAVVRLTGGTLAGGAWTLTGGAFIQVATSAEARLTNPTIAGDVILTDFNSRVRIASATSFTTLRFRSGECTASFDPGFVLGGQIIADANSANAHIDQTADGTFTIGPTGVIATAPVASATITFGSGYWYSGVMNVNHQGVVSHAASSGSFHFNPASVTMASAARAENTAGGTLTMSVNRAPFAWTNAGTIRATAGVVNLNNSLTNSGTIEVSASGRVNLVGAWNNLGTFQLAGTGRLDLGGTFATTNIGTINRAGGGLEGTINVTGVWTNTAQTFNFNASTGSFQLLGGTISGGILNTSGSARLIAGNAVNSLNGVAYNGELLIDGSNARATINTGTTLTSLRVRGFQSGVSFAAGSIINYPIVIDGTGSVGTIGLDGANGGSLTFGPSCSITAQGDWTGSVTIGPSWWIGAVAVVNQGTITLSGPSRSLVLGGNGFDNFGTVSVSGGTSLRVDITGFNTNTWTCPGVMSISDSTLTTNDLWTVSGTINVTNTACDLDGQFTTASIQRITRSGGQVNIVGRLDNTGRATTLSPATGSWRLVGGTIVGGSLGDTPTDRLILTSGSGSIDSVTLNSELLLDGANARVRILGTTTVPAIRLRSTQAGVSFSNGYVITYPIISDSPVATTHGLDSTAAGSTLSFGSTGSFTSAPGSLASMSVGDNWWSSQIATLNNAGLIQCSAADRALNINPGVAFGNTGTVRVRSGADASVSGLSGTVGGFDIADAGTTLVLNGSNYVIGGTLSIGTGTTATLRGSWSNAGTIAIQNGTLELGGTFSFATLGTFTNSGGTVRILGTLNNPTALTLDAATGSWVLAGGTINGGTVNQTQGSLLGFANSTTSTLSNVQFSSELVVGGSGARVHIDAASSAPSFRLTGAGSSLAFAPGYTITQTITAEGTGNKGIESSAPGSLTISPTGRILVEAGSLSIGAFALSGNRTVNNQGLIQASGSGTTVNINPTTIANLDANTGTLTGGNWKALAGANLLFNSPVRVNHASLEFSGVGAAPTFLDTLESNSGTLVLGAGRDASILSGVGSSTLTNSGTLVLGPGSRLQLGNAQRACGFVQTPTGTTRFELGGLSQSTGYGSMRVFGQAALDGAVNAEYVNGFARQCGQVFNVIDANSRTGQFATRSLPPITPETLFLLFYGGADVRFTVSARADFNNDGFLDIFDYDEFVNCFEGNCLPGTDADFNGDGFVDIFDYDDFVFRFEAGCE